MYHKNYSEVDLQFIYKSTLANVKFLKSINVCKPKLKLAFVFKNVLEFDFIKIFDYILILWYITGKKANIKNLGQTLRRGIRYYRFTLNIEIIDNFRILSFFEFLMNDLIPFVGVKSLLKNFNNIFICCITVSNIDGFSNLRLSDNFYLSGVKNDLIVYVLTNNANYFNSSYFFLSLLKLI